MYVIVFNPNTILHEFLSFFKMFKAYFRHCQMMVLSSRVLGLNWITEAWRQILTKLLSALGLFFPFLFGLCILC